MHIKKLYSNDNTNLNRPELKIILFNAIEQELTYYNYFQYNKRQENASQTHSIFNVNHPNKPTHLRR